jgi:membrane-bound lytic murein transglycosylase A
MFKKFVLFVVALHVLAGCAAPIRKPSPQPSPSPPFVKPVSPREKPAPSPAIPQPVSSLTHLPDDNLPQFADDMDLESLEKAVEKSLQYYKRSAGKGSVRMDDTWVSVRDLQDSLIALREILRRGEPEEVRQARIRETFDVYQSIGSDGKNTVLFTGYFESSLKGSLTKTDRYRYPIYKAPDDAVIANLGKFGDRYKNEQLIGRVMNGELVPYYTRGEIENQGTLDGRGLELAWVDDRVDLFFMHTQGSGRIELTDGRILNVGYAFRNGRPFQSISPYMLKTGKITPQENSFREIKKYLKEHPDELPEILGFNENFIFFRVVAKGPLGAIEEVLTPGRSIATDQDLFPKGALAFIRARKPILDKEGNVESWIPLSRFAVSQDVGSAIKGPGRVDLFCGSGSEAEMLAGSLKERGELYFLVKKRVNGGAD